MIFQHFFTKKKGSVPEICVAQNDFYIDGQQNQVKIYM